MEYRVLGPLETRVEDRPLEVPGGRRRDLLAVLLLHSGQMIPADRLIDILWSEALPQAPRTALQGVVAGLRRALAPGHDGPSPLITLASGYRLDVGAGELDMDTFEEFVAGARRNMSQRKWVEAAERLDEALGLWRGPPLGGVDAHELVHVQALRLEERRLVAVEDYMDAQLGCGRHTELVAELESYVAVHPLRERWWVQLMLALYRAGRQADALRAYHDVREKLADELGLDPGAELQRTQQAVLTADPSLDAPPARAMVASPKASSPAQLPTDIGDLTGRAQQIDGVCGLLEGGHIVQPSAVPVVGIAGQAGVGKTALAARVAHRVRPHFPEGQLYVNLRGAGPSPREAGEVLGWFLRALGVDPAALPEDEEARAQAYRSRLDGRQVLVVLDNAASEAQIRQLLPGSASCAVLVTSRSRLAGLEGSKLIDLQALELDQGVELLARLAGETRVAAEPQAVEQIVRSCGGLPLALRVAGARLAAYPEWGMAHLAGRLAGRHRRLDELAAGDLDVRASVGLSYGQLGPDSQRALRLLGLWEAEDFPLWVPGALLDVSLSRAEELVGALVELRLVDVARTDAVGQVRYRLHDLIRSYAWERVVDEDPETERRAALGRVLGSYLALADQAAGGMPAAVPRQELGFAPRWHLDPGHAARATQWPGGWFGAEQASLVTAVDQATALGLDDVAWELAAAQVPGPFILDSRLDEWWCTHQAALAATRYAGNPRGEAAILHGLGRLRLRQTRLDEADAYLRPALRGFREVGSELGEAAVLDCLGMVRHLRGRLDEAAAFLEQAHRIFREHHDGHAAACVTLHLGALHSDQGRYRQALENLSTAQAVFLAAGDRRGQARTLSSRGSVHQARGHLDQARDAFQQAQHTAREAGDRLITVYACEALAAIQTRRGQTALAEPLLVSCLDEFRELHDPYGEALTLGAFGELHHTRGRLEQAHKYLYAALSQWKDLQVSLWQGRTLRHLGQLHMAQGDSDTAEATWRAAFGLFQQLDMPEAAEFFAHAG